MPDSVKSRLGDIINGYVVVAQYKDKIILAESIEPKVRDSAVVWQLDYYGDPCRGDYFSNTSTAQYEFARRAFGW